MRRKQGDGGYAHGYKMITVDGRRVREHIVLVERLLGKPLPPDAEVHHVNGDRADNRPQNLVVCPNHAYHALLHLRQAALAASGHPHYRMCTICKQWDDPSSLKFTSNGANPANASPKVFHQRCMTARRKEIRHAKRTAANEVAVTA